MINKFKVTGMSCSACSSNVEKKVRSIAGVNHGEVNLLKNRLTVDFDESKVTDADIIRSIEKIGYGVEPWEEEPVLTSSQMTEKEEKNEDQESAEMKKRLFFSIAWLIPLMYISMGHMIHLPLPSFLVGVKFGVNFALMQMLFTIPVLYLNRKFFQIGLKALWHRVPNMDSLVAVGSGAAFIYGVFAIFRMSTGLAQGNMDLVSQYHMDLYFESAAMILTLVTVGKYLETRSKGKTSKAVEKLMDLAPKQSLVEIGRASCRERV